MLPTGVTTTGVAFKLAGLLMRGTLIVGGALLLKLVGPVTFEDELIFWLDIKGALVVAVVVSVLFRLTLAGRLACVC